MNNKITIFSVSPLLSLCFTHNFFALKKCEKNNFYIVRNLWALKAEAFTFIWCIIYFEDYLILQSMMGGIVAIEMKHNGKQQNWEILFCIFDFDWSEKIMKQEFPDLLNLLLISRKQPKSDEGILKYNPEIQTNTNVCGAALFFHRI